jgi:pilus assembly protein CpaF
MVTVTISEKGGQQSQYEFNKSEITIGRMKGNDIVLPKGNVSKKHSRISVRDGNVQIVDLNSTNGTYVNGRKVTSEQPITENDKVYIGDFILQVESPETSQPPAAPPSPPQGGARGGGRGSQAGGGAPPSPPQSNAGGNGGGRGPQGGAASSSGGGRQRSSSGFGGSGPVDDLFAAGDSSPSMDQRDIPSSGPTGGAGRDSAASNPVGGAQSRSGSGSEPALDFNDLAGGGGGAAGNSRPPRDTGAGSSGPPAGSAGSSGPGGLGAGSSASTGRAPDRSGRGGSAPEQVDRPAQPQRASERQAPAGAQASYPQGTGYAPPRELQSEFDSDFHAAQHDVARVLFESISLDALPIQYPPVPSDRQDFERQVEDAVSTVNPQGDRDALVDLMATECVGLGPLEEYLDDPNVRDIYVNRYDQILVRRGGEIVVAERAFSHPDFLLIAAQRLLGTRDPIGSDEVRFGDGTRVHVVMPPLSVDGPALTVRKPPQEHPSLDELVTRGALSPGMQEFLERAVEAGQSILVAGPTSSGKSTLLGAIARTVTNGTRIVTVEESSHLHLPQDTVVRLEADPAAGHDLRFLVRTAVSMHPQRIILDECRGGEAYEWVTAAASGTEGSMLTTHGTNSADALGRLESLALLGSPDTSPRGLREQIARAVDVVVVVNRTRDNAFRVRQVTEVQGVDLDAFRLNDVFYYRVEGTEEQFHPTGYIPLFYEDLRHAGMDVDFDIFRE